MNEKIFELIVAGEQKKEIARILSFNDKTKRYGLTLTDKDAGLLLAGRRNTLKEQRRVEFGESILPKIIEAFCDSQYINQDDYVEMLMALQDIFHLYKNESQDQLTDDELLTFMREQFEGLCFGSLEYLSETCLERFARAIRGGYCGYQNSGGWGEYGNDRLSEEERWDKELFMAVWDELIS